MGCGCNSKPRGEAITSNVANAMIEEARRQTAEEEMAALVASVNNAIGNAGGGNGPVNPSSS